MINIPSDVIRISLTGKKKKADIKPLHNFDFLESKKDCKLTERYDNYNSNKKLAIGQKNKINFFELNNDKKDKIDEQLDEKKGKKIKLNFLIENLRYDRRIKNMKKENGQICLYFWTVADSISFYKQHILEFEMKFGAQKHDVDKNEVWRGFTMCSDISLSFLKLKLICSDTKNQKFNKKDVIEEKVEIKVKFDLIQRTDYFCKMSKFYSVNDLKYLQLTVFEQTHELILNYTRELAVGIASNVIFQDIINKMNQKDLENIVDNLEYDLAPMCSTKYGAYSIQSLLMLLTESTAIEKVKKYFDPFIINLCKHPIGNYTVQKILKLDSNFIFNHIKDNFLTIMTDELGYKVFKSCLDDFTDKYDIIRNLLNKNIMNIELKRVNEMNVLLSKNK